MSFGAFMKGMQGGMSTMQDLRRQRQLDDVYDAALTESEYDLAGKERARERAGLPPIARRKSSQTFLGRLSDRLDPVMARMMGGVGRGTGTIESPTASALPVAEEFSPENYQYQFDENPILLAEGGLTKEELAQRRKFELARNQGGAGRDIPSRLNEVNPEKLSLAEDTGPKSNARPRYNPDSPDAVRERAARARASGAPQSAIPESVNDTTQPKPKSPPKPTSRLREAAKYKGYGLAAKPGAGMLNRAGKFVGRVGAPAVILGAGVGGVRGALGAESDAEIDPSRYLEVGEGTSWYDPLIDPSFYGDMGNRAIQAGKGAVAGALSPLDALTGAGEEQQPSAIPEVPAAPAAAPAAATATPAVGGARRQSAVPTTAPAEEDPFADFDVTKVRAADIPNFSNQDWVSFREEAIKDYVSAGMSYGEAWEKVDQQVVSTQQRGFMHFGNQARQLLAAGNLRGAASAVRAAFQYLPSTTDLQVGEYNGHLVAFAVDEDSGKQVGRPIPIDDKLLNDVLMNFSDRKAWAEHAQDNRKMDQADRGLGQTDRQIGIAERMAGVHELNARTAAMGGAGAGLKPSDIDRATVQIFRDEAAAVSEDPRVQSALTSVMTRIYMDAYARGDRRPAAEIANRVAQYAQTEEGLQEILSEASAARN